MQVVNVTKIIKFSAKDDTNIAMPIQIRISG